MPGPMRGRMPKGKKIENPGKVFKRLMKYVAKSYGPHLVIVAILIFVSVLANVQGTMFIQSLIIALNFNILTVDLISKCKQHASKYYHVISFT